MATSNALDPGRSSEKTMKLENTDKRDKLIANEKKYQEAWRRDHIFEHDAPTTSEIPFSTPAAEIHAKHPKFFATMAFPYMNGTLHAGHSFTASKVEFTTGFARMLGKRALFPLGFHCTGMPIKACADKLTNEVKMFGKDFEGYKDPTVSEPVENGDLPAPVQGVKKEDITKFSSSKSKTAAKTVQAKYQFQIMLSLGIPKGEIYKFADANHWLSYFPPICEQDLNSFGARIDWRRKFVTTDANPYFDSFVRWQMIRLKEKNKIQHGKRYTIYSPRDGQPCMDHDRSKGEGVGPTEYTALKLEVKDWSEAAGKLIYGTIPRNAKVFFTPATLRPETMYGQVCCFVGPKIKYGVFKISELEYYVCTRRAAWNMAFQGTFFDTDHFPREESELQPILEADGSAFVGTLVNAPLSVHTSGIRILPMETVSATKGTGVVTSVPSDSPDDYATMRDLAKKAGHYGIQKEWAELEILPIIRVPIDDSDIDLIAKYLVEKLKIQSPKDAKQLEEAKDIAYKDGFYKGTMLVGEFKGHKVEDAKPRIRQALLESGEAFAYADPAGYVESRSGQECVVANLGQWFLNYGQNDQQWQHEVLSYIKSGNTKEGRDHSVFANAKPRRGLQTFLPETATAFEKNIDWLNQWACARTYGLGSKLPWDPNFLVESLSDSTIYMAYYTIAHLLHRDEFGHTPGKLNVKPEQMSDEVWDYLFLEGDLSEDLVKSSGISKANLQTMRREFEYWYPLDMRVSGKDLILNHLTFFLYVHLALFPPDNWPCSIRSNGHLMLNGEKMSKSTGNFLTLSQAVQKFGADATRIALADAGDGIDDANFDESTANAAILTMFKIKDAIEGELKNSGLREDDAKDIIWDELFEDEMHELVHQTKQHYERTHYKDALKSSFYDFQEALYFYQKQCRAANIAPSRRLITKFAKLQSLTITPIAPHWAEDIWIGVLGEKDTVQNALWPAVPQVQQRLVAIREYARTTSDNILSKKVAQKTKKKGKKGSEEPSKPQKVILYVTNDYPAWQDEYVQLLKKDLSGSLAEKKLEGMPKGKEKTRDFAFVREMKNIIANGDSEAVLERKMPFDEVEVLEQMSPGLKFNGGLADVKITMVNAGNIESMESPHAAASAVPGKPTFMFVDE
jgi:leucyl-tRNA synthetase